MQKVLILSYFFPPCTLTASERIQGWANYLNEFDYYPIIITRDWNREIKTPEDVLKSSSTELVHTKNSKYEVFHLPYKASFRDKLFTQNSSSKVQYFSKPLTFLNLILENYRIKSITHHNLYTFSRKYLSNNSDVKKMIISGNPFNQFFFGYKLKKEFDIKWIADYRDDWNTTELTDKKGLLNTFIQFLQKRSEKKWVSSASTITSISPYYTKKIADFVKVPGEVVLNGYEIPYIFDKTKTSSKFTITYNGSLYASQPIEVFLDAAIQLINEGFEELFIQFPGLAFSPIQSKRVSAYAKEILNHLSITKRIPKKEILQLQVDSDIVLMISHNNIKGVPSSKLYEYIGLNKTVLLYPNDNDIIEETLKETNLGVVCNSYKDIYSSIKKMLLLKRENNLPLVASKNIEKFSRKNQTKHLAEILNNL